MSKVSIYFTLGNVDGKHDVKDIKKTLDTLPGVESVSVNAETGSVAVDYDTTGVLSDRQEWIAECVKRGIFFTNHHNHFINAALSDEDIQETIDVATEAFEVIRNRHPL